MAERTTRRRPGRPKDEVLTAQRREAILEMATRVFAERGYRHTDVEAVAAAAGVGKGTVYRHFPDKRALFLSAVDQGMQGLQTCVDGAAPDCSGSLEDLRAAMEAGIRAHLTFFDKHPEVVELLIQERAEFKDRRQPTYVAYAHRNKARWKPLVEALRAQGRLRDLPHDEMHEFMTQIIYGTMFVNYFRGRRRSIAAQVRRIVDVVLFGVLTDAERHRLAPPAAPGPTPQGTHSQHGRP
ncbi:MAG TPA: TetR/AcrR family transcriptional regulator [bacterium]|nr:TetR/AcrR family transcriptional regulator [bacterium]